MPDASRILPEIRELIETSRHRVAVAANLVLVNLYWNIGRVITLDIQKSPRRAEYGTQLLEKVAALLTREYGSGYSKINLQDMRRFYERFQIDQTPSDLFGLVENDQTMSDESAEMILQAPSAEFSACIPIDFRKHFTLGWSHYRVLLGQQEPRKRKFYFEQAAAHRWSVRELQRKIEGALYERVALSRDTRKLAALEKKNAPEVVRYNDILGGRAAGGAPGQGP